MPITDRRDQRNPDRPERIAFEDLSHAEAAKNLLGQIARSEVDRSNRNKEPYDPEIKIKSAFIHALLAIEERLAEIAELLDDGSD